MCPGETACGCDGGRFGFCLENGEFQKVLNFINEYSHIKIAGLHLHCSSKTRSLGIYHAIAEVACKIAQEFNLKLSYIDIGGGYFGGMPEKPQFTDYLKELENTLSARFDPATTTLILEPGMSLIGSPISYVTTVTDIKDTTYNRFVVTDGSCTHIDPLMHKSSYFYKIHYNNQTDREMIKKQVICGFTCMEADRLFVLEDSPELMPGDVIVYNKVGAYTLNLSPQFICYLPDIYVCNEGKENLIQKRWTAYDVARKRAK